MGLILVHGFGGESPIAAGDPRLTHINVGELRGGDVIWDAWSPTGVLPNLGKLKSGSWNLPVVQGVCRHHDTDTVNVLLAGGAVVKELRSANPVSWVPRAVPATSTPEGRRAAWHRACGDSLGMLRRLRRP